MSILENNLDKVSWYWLSSNPNAIHLLEKNLDKVDWSELSLNPNAMHILEKNLDKIDWARLSTNPGIFKPTINYSKIMASFDPLKRELCKLFFHPSRMNIESIDDEDYEKQFIAPVVSMLKAF